MLLDTVQDLVLVMNYLRSLKPPYRLSVSLFILSCGLYELTNINAALEASEYEYSRPAVATACTYILASSVQTLTIKAPWVSASTVGISLTIPET